MNRIMLFRPLLFRIGDAVKAMSAKVAAQTIMMVALVAVSPAAAQTPDSTTTDTTALASLGGRLINAQSGEPITGATIELEAKDRSVLTDRDGRFSFDELPPGEYRLQIRHVGFGTRTTQVQAHRGRSTHMTIELAPRAIEVEPLRVQVEHRLQELRDVGFYRRRSQGWGEFMAPEAVDRWIAPWPDPGRWLRVLSSQGNTTDLINCPPNCGNVVFYVDRERMSSAQVRRASWLSGKQVGAVEVYPDGHGAPAFALTPSAKPKTVVVIWTEDRLRSNSGS